MSNFSQILIQKNQVSTYSPGSNTCKAGTCDSSTKVQTCRNCDWHYADVTCAIGCPNQPLCSELDKNTCPAFGESLVSAEWNTGINGTCPVNPEVKCIYDSSKFTFNDIVAYKSQFCENNSCTGNSNFNSILMPEFCMQTDKVCPAPLKTCPEILSNTTAGEACNSWSTNNPKIFDSTIKSFCSDSSQSVCLCVNKNSDPVFTYINKNLNPKFSPGCWYIPCTDPNVQLVPTEDITSGCNQTEMCTNINNIIRTVPTNLTKAQLSAKINCNNLADPIPLDPTDGASTGTSFMSSWIFWIILIIVIIFIIVIIIIGLNRK